MKGFVFNCDFAFEAASANLYIISAVESQAASNFERTKWTIPDKRFCFFQHFANVGNRRGTCIQDHRIRGAGVGGQNLACGARFEFTGHNDVTGQDYFATRILGFAQNFSRGSSQIMFAKRFANIDALSGQKCIRHAATNDQMVDLADKIA